VVIFSTSQAGHDEGMDAWVEATQKRLPMAGRESITQMMDSQTLSRHDEKAAMQAAFS